MNNNDLTKLIEHTREVSVKNIANLASKTNEDIGHFMIIFNTKTISTKKVNDWGREKDDDWYLGIDLNGWVIYKNSIEHMAGEPKIIDSSNTNIDDIYIVNYLLSDDCSIEYYLDFMETCAKIRSKCSNDFQYKSY